MPEPLKPAVHRDPREGFREDSRTIGITPAERTLSILTKNYFDSTLKRNTPWLIKNGEIRITRPYKPQEVLGQTLELPPKLWTERIITGDELEREAVSPLLGEVMFTFKRIEDKLADFSGRSYDLFRNIWGINNSYHQWSYEENQHSDALGLILSRVRVAQPNVAPKPEPHQTTEQLQADYMDNLTRTWEPPFKSARQMVLYAAFQEQLTSLNYRALAKRATEEGAPTTAEILALIAMDEAYHGGGYRAFSRIYADDDLAGTIGDAAHVGMNFRMPAQHLMRNPRRNSLEIVRVGAFSKELVSEDTIGKVLKGLGFVPDAVARGAADAYWSDKPEEAQARVMALVKP